MRVRGAVKSFHKAENRIRDAFKDEETKVEN